MPLKNDIKAPKYLIMKDPRYFSGISKRSFTNNWEDSNDGQRRLIGARGRNNALRKPTDAIMPRALTRRCRSTHIVCPRDLSISEILMSRNFFDHSGSYWQEADYIVWSQIIIAVGGGVQERPSLLPRIESRGRGQMTVKLLYNNNQSYFGSRYIDFCNKKKIVIKNPVAIKRWMANSWVLNK